MSGYLFVTLLAIANIGLMAAAIFLFKQVKKSGIYPHLGKMVSFQVKMPVRTGKNDKFSNIGANSKKGTEYGTKLR